MAFLYHYSEKKFKQLETIRHRGEFTKKLLKEQEDWIKFNLYPGIYMEHISFFMEPVPLDIIAKSFKGSHPFWKSGNILFEHRVKIESLTDFYYQIVESPLVVAMRDNFPDVEETDEMMGGYYRALKEIQISVLERGDSVKNFLRIQKAYEGKVRECFQKLPLRKDFEEIKDKYAATVPHVMIYPKSGIIMPDKIELKHVY